MFKLNKNTPQGLAINLPPDIKYSKNCINSELFKKRFSAILAYFIKKVEQIPGIDLSYLYHNLETLKIETNKNRRKSLKERTVAYYDSFENAIYIYVITSFYHELLHVASTFYDKENKRVYMGFSQAIKVDKNYYGCGRGLNEGYTELLANRYFGKEIDGYIEQAKIASWVESIIGSNLMMKYYFKADLFSLFNDFGLYADGDLVNNLFENIDTVHRNVISDVMVQDENSLIKSYKKVYTILLTMVTNKWTRAYQNGNISENALKEVLKNYFENCGMTENEFCGSKLTYLTDSEKEQIINSEYEANIKVK